MSEPIGAEAAAERLAAAFTRPMRAATSRWGVVTDPPIVCAAMAVVVLISVILYNLNIINRAELPFVYGAIALPAIVAVVVHVSLASARSAVVAWLGGLPFPVENVNALLNGVAHHLVVRFSAEPPKRERLTDMLDEVHTDCFALEFHDDEPEVELVIGVADSKINPAAASHRRFLRVHRMIDECLVPLAEEHSVEWVRVA